MSEQNYKMVSFNGEPKEEMEMIIAIDLNFGLHLLGSIAQNGLPGKITKKEMPTKDGEKEEKLVFSSEITIDIPTDELGRFQQFVAQKQEDVEVEIEEEGFTVEDK